jgi:hypothetical protein
VVIRFVNFGEIVDHHSLNFPSLKLKSNALKTLNTVILTVEMAYIG